jgi:Fe2+ or Zn2+ uptake regulation protein
MNKSGPYSSHLRAHGYRLTPQRLAIFSILQEAGCHLTPGEVYERAQAVMPGLTEATVYRTLNFLVEQGFALAAHVGSGQLVFEIAEHDHHHLICKACGLTHEIDHAALEALYEQFQADTGFLIDSVHVTFFGLCPDCQKLGSGQSCIG